MSERKKTRSDQEWLDLIHECRASGLPDKEWCQLHSISIKTFHNKVSDLRKKSCKIPEPQAVPSKQKHEVVPLDLSGSPAIYPDHAASGTMLVPAAHAAVTVRMLGYIIEIANGASEDTIRSTLLALGRLC